MAEGADDRAGEAVAHLQAAAREMIAAARAFLDVAEEVVEEPGAGEALLRTVGDVARRIRPEGGPDDEGDRVEHIPVD